MYNAHVWDSSFYVSFNNKITYSRQKRTYHQDLPHKAVWLNYLLIQ